MTFAEFCFTQCNHTLTRSTHKMCQKCEGNSLEVMADETSPDNFDEKSNFDIESNVDESSISGCGEENPSPFNQKSNLLYSTMPVDIISQSSGNLGNTSINNDTCTCLDCDIGFALSDDLLSCIGE